MSDHQRVSYKLTLAIGSHVDAHRLGRVYYAPLVVVLSEHDIVELGLFFVATERLAIVQDDRLTSPLLPGLEISLREILTA